MTKRNSNIHYPLQILGQLFHNSYKQKVGFVDTPPDQTSLQSYCRIGDTVLMLDDDRRRETFGLLVARHTCRKTSLNLSPVGGCHQVLVVTAVRIIPQALSNEIRIHAF